MRLHHQRRREGHRGLPWARAIRAGQDSLTGWVVVNDSALRLELADPFFVMAAKEGYVQLELTEVAE